MELSEYSGINDYTIKLEDNKQPIFWTIYSIKPVKLETLKTFIKINLANNFTSFFKSFTKILIFFDWKLDKSFCFCIDYWDFNNITIKN